MDLYDVDGMLLLDACAKKLESVVLYPTDGEQLPLRGVQALAHDLAAKYRPLPDFDPPWNESLSQVERMEEVSLHCKRLEALREVYKVREFHLVLRVSVWGCVGESPVQMLEETVAEEKAKWGLVVVSPTHRWYTIR